ncbi:MAG TPA: serine/threonine-protein kinase [Candidatus Dormibacteraeota bacterium]
MSIAEGTRLGAYEVQEFIGQGAMGLVYKAWHEALARPAAVKVLQALAPDTEASGRFRREAQSIAQMRHPNILNVFDFGEFEGVPYMIVEYVPGGSLADRLKSGERLDPELAVAMLRGLAAALDYAHSLGVVHRDVKPANVLVGRDGAPILADFGLAKLLQSASVKSMTGVTTGTPAYMAPEQVTGSAVGPAADRYALAAVAYELLTGMTPFTADGVLELLYAHVHRDPTPPSQRNAALPAAVDAVLLKGLAKQPEARWGSCREMVDELAAAMTAQPAAVAPVEATMVMPPRPAPVRRRRRSLVGIAALVVVLLVLAGGLLLLRAGKQPSVAVTPTSVVAGQTVTVTAHNLPAGQSGSIALTGPAREIGLFQADARGDLKKDVRIPPDAIGQHDLELCWAGACHGATPVTVHR